MPGTQTGGKDIMTNHQGPHGLAKRQVNQCAEFSKACNKGMYGVLKENPQA